MRGVAFTPDGSTIASMSANNIIDLWDSNDGKIIKTLEDILSFCKEYCI